MAATTMVHVRLNEDVKIKASRALEAMGLSVSDAVRAFLTHVAVEKRLPFALHVPNAETRAAMVEADRLIKARSARFVHCRQVFDALSQKPR